MSETVGRAFEERCSSKRIFALDAVRGVAAFVVLWYHYRLAFETNAVPWYLRPLFAGRQAVVLFFLLSGYVLSLPYWRGQALGYRAYLVRRWFRIYVPYAAAVGIALVGAWWWMGARLPLTPWFYKTWHTPLSLGLVVRQLLMGTGGELNTAFWSLRYEMQMSIVFPAVCWVLLRLGPARALWPALAVAGAGAVLRSASLVWGSCFLLGAAMAGNRSWLGGIYGRLAWVDKVMLAVSVAIAYCSEWEPGMIVGGCGVLLLAEHSRAREWLEGAVPRYLGRVSYSVYLLHGTVLQVTLIVLYGRVPVVVLGGVFLVGTMVVSHAFCVWVEEPSSRLGRRLTRGKMRPREEFVNEAAVA